jgi:hypothetical protein
MLIAQSRARAYRARRARRSARRQAAEVREQERLAQELDRDVALPCSERPPQPDLRATLEDGDDHDVGDADPADEELRRMVREAMAETDALQELARQLSAVAVRNAV